MTVSITTFCIKCHHDECHYAECHDLFIVMLNVIMLNVVMLNLVAPFCNDDEKNNTDKCSQYHKTFSSLLREAPGK